MVNTIVFRDSQLLITAKRKIVNNQLYMIEQSNTSVLNYFKTVRRSPAKIQRTQNARSNARSIYDRLQ